ncbi:unnamed protein product [Penicillium salamii]|uniref:Uncharacterized protein n=1 Tax=Penicillium salamii TaxID=1612424 RepID=A0A9W4JWG1_9EURO|nr:unnamed protein product [Penicillium salamii]CAG8029725.1 unnamed protein product [Penicillium salamii]CAG8173657.1 unnamed protein product [Penicillium salamii]CAG8217749.1 unnamed protein product [Penicillium salamii]CAG8229221.1 unnamed protein product [Penicillium salamii]
MVPRHPLDCWEQRLIEMESEVHASGCDAFKFLIEAWVNKLKSVVTPTGTAMFRGITRKQKADCSWKPAELPSGRSPKWPTMAVEVRWSESASHLMNDVCFWLNESNGDVKVMLTVSIFARHRISIEKMGLERNSKRKVTGNMTILFEDVFLRPKRPTETDLTFSQSDLERMALKIWAVQDR